MTAAIPILHDISHITPIRCPACKFGKAHLVHRRPDPYGGGKPEIWVFECDGCGALSAQPVES